MKLEKATEQASQKNQDLKKVEQKIIRVQSEIEKLNVF
jgi:hypothetical protein